MMESKYLSKMKDLSDSKLLAINGNRLLIELLDEVEKVTKSGIITGVVPDKSIHALDKAKAAVVLAVGSGYTIENESGEDEDVALSYNVGDIILVNQFAVKTFGQFFQLHNYKENSIGLITDDLVQGKIGDLEQFNAVLKR
jgi:co-chaperonin GroES (HSP10)